MMTIQSHDSSSNCYRGVGIGGDISPVLDKTMTVTLNLSHFGYEDTGKALAEEERQSLLTQSDDATIDFMQYNSTFI